MATWRLYFQSVFWISVGLISLYFCDIWESYLKKRMPFQVLVIMGFIYLLLLCAYMVFLPLPYSAMTFGRFGNDKPHLKKLVKCFFEILFVWLTALLKAKISKTDMKQGQIAPYVLAISIYFSVVMLVELVLNAKDFGSIHAAASVIVMLLIMGGFGFWAVPISTAIVFVKTLMMAECCEECRERKKTKRQKEKGARSFELGR